MKLNKIGIFLGAAALLLTGCERELPYDLDGVTEGVLIDIYRVADTGTQLEPGVTDGNYALKMSIPWQQGDYSHLDKAQLMLVYTASKQTPRTIIVKDNIAPAEFPLTVQLDMASIYSQLGLTAPAYGDRLDFVPNVVLKDGTVIQGWNPYPAPGGAFNNTIFTGWTVDGRAYSYRVTYTAPNPFDPNIFQGRGTVVAEYGYDWISYGLTYPLTSTLLDLTDPANQPDPALLPSGVTLDDITGLRLSGAFAWPFDGAGPGAMNIWVINNTLEIILEDFSDLGFDGTGNYMHSLGGQGKVNTIDNQIYIEYTLDWQNDGVYDWDFTVQF